MDELVKNGDIWDIGQTINGVSRFVFIDNIWYYYEERMLYNDPKKSAAPNTLSEYEYEYSSITDVIRAVYSGSTRRRVGNVNDLMKDMVVVK